MKRVGDSSIAFFSSGGDSLSLRHPVHKFVFDLEIHIVTIFIIAFELKVLNINRLVSFICNKSSKHHFV